jgi:hypothetical protein
MHRQTRRAAILAISLLVVTAGAKDFALPRAFHAKTYPARDVHDDEKFSVAVDPYDVQDKQAQVFNIDYRKEGLLPLHVIFSNDADSPATISRVLVTFVTRNNAKLVPEEAEDIYRRISKTLKRGDEPKVIQLPDPLGGRKKKGNVSARAREEVELISAHPRAVEPRSTQSAIYVFNVEGIDHPLAGARVVITGVRRDNQELFYFEIPMERYLTYTAAPENKR